jgi:hypothetical protein
MNGPGPVEIGILADALNDIEALRIRTANQHQALITPADQHIGDKGGRFGKGLSEVNPAVLAHGLHLADIEEREAALVAKLERAVKDSVWGPWITGTVGLGTKTMGRLIGAVGDPADRPNPAKLWAYCGLHVVDGHAPRHEKGVQSNWSDEARKRAYVIAQGCIKATKSPYRVVYDKGRVKYDGAVHEDQCQTNRPAPGQNGCGTKANPELGAPGSPLRDGHVHKRAVRLIMKAVVLDLWLVADGQKPQYGTGSSRVTRRLKGGG